MALGQGEALTVPKGRLRLLWRLLALLAAMLIALASASAGPSATIVSWDGVSDASINDINALVGATRFYDAGYFGGNTLIANVEAGHVWNQHETLQNSNILYVNDPSMGPVSSLYDWHATAVGFTLVGLGPQLSDGSYYTYQFGMAPGSTLVSTAIATNWVGTSGEFDISTQTLDYGYSTVMQTGVTIPLAPGLSMTRTADVINNSLGLQRPHRQHPDNHDHRRPGLRQPSDRRDGRGQRRRHVAAAGGRAGVGIQRHQRGGPGHRHVLAALRQRGVVLQLRAGRLLQSADARDDHRRAVRRGHRGPRH